MTGPEPTGDEELDAFARSALGQQLQGMAQPEPPAALDDAILARAAADHARAAPANDARAGFLRRARVPLAIAASAVFGLGLLLEQGLPPASQPVGTTAPAARPAAVDRKPEPPGETVVELKRPAPPAAAPLIVPPPPPEPAPMVSAMEAMPASQAPVAAPAPPAPAAAPPAPAEQMNPGAPQPEAEAAPAAPKAAPATPVLAPAPPAPAPVTALRSATPANDLQRRLARLDALLQSNREEDARAAWEDLRRAYPSYEPPPELARKLQALEPPGDGRK
jgi:hypothetical protein